MDKKELNLLAENNDKNWDKVMKLAKENGFILQAFGGTATLSCNKVQIEQLGYEKYQTIQETNGVLRKNKLEG